MLQGGYKRNPAQGIRNQGAMISSQVSTNRDGSSNRDNSGRHSSNEDDNEGRRQELFDMMKL